MWEARLSTQAPDIDGVCYLGDPGEGPLAPGQFRTMRITEAHDYDLVGDLIDEAPAAAPVNPFNVLPATVAASHRSALPHR